MIKSYEVPNLLLDDEPILKNESGCDIHWEEGRRLMYRDVKKNQRSNSSKRVGNISTLKKSERTNSLFNFFR